MRTKPPRRRRSAGALAIGKRLVGLVLSKLDVVKKALDMAHKQGLRDEELAIVFVGQKSGLEVAENTAIVQRREAFFAFVLQLGLEVPPPAVGHIPTAVLDHGQGAVTWLVLSVAHASDGAAELLN